MACAVLADVCPIVEPMKDFNTSEYIRSTWFSQQQQITAYQKDNSVYCVLQTLNTDGGHVPLYDGPVISVYNYANVDVVNGVPLNDDNTTLCARQFDKSSPANILNAPCFLPNQAAGPYWVLDAGPSTNHYEWAIVSGGPPTEEYEDGCTNKIDTVKGSGLWLFTRDALDSGNYVELMRQKLLSMGYTLSQLLSVSHEGCTYKGAYLKN